MHLFIIATGIVLPLTLAASNFAHKTHPVFYDSLVFGAETGGLLRNDLYSVEWNDK